MTYINSLNDLTNKIKTDSKDWNVCPWFRGQSNEDYILLPSILRKLQEDSNANAVLKNQNCEFMFNKVKLTEEILKELEESRTSIYDIEKQRNDIKKLIKESEITSKFIRKATLLDNSFKSYSLDQQLYLMQHVGLPTRLMDWTESALTSLYFAINKCYKEKIKSNPVIWMLNPFELNVHSGKNRYNSIENIEISNDARIRDAFGISRLKEDYDKDPQYPIAIYPTYIHQRMGVQKSCFTVHGSDKRHFEWLYKDSLIKNNFLIKYIIDKDAVEDIYQELKLLGITHSSLFPDLDGLSKEIKMEYKY